MLFKVIKNKLSLNQIDFSFTSITIIMINTISRQVKTVKQTGF